jgi:RND family efflux transporter MFP subunit
MHALSASVAALLLGLPTIASAQVFPINCTIKPSQVIEISSVIDGVVAEVMVERGQKVEAGTPILRLDDDISRAELSVAERRAELTAGLEAAQIEQSLREQQVQRFRSAYNRRAVSLAELEEVELALALATNDIQRQQQELDILAAETERAALLLSKSTIRSPVAGVIGEDLARPGESLSGRLVTTLTVLDPLRVEAFVPTAMLDGIDTATLEVDGRDIDQGSVELDYVSGTANLSSGTISVFFDLTDSSVTPGQSCRMRMPS